MQALCVDVRQSEGKVLSCAIFREGGHKLLSRGHVLTQEDVRVLQGERLEQVWVAGVQDGEVGEDEAVMELAARVGSGSLEVRLAPGGRANLLANRNCCVLVDDSLLRRFNGSSPAVIATLPNFSHAPPGRRIATVKSVPFTVPRPALEAAVGVLMGGGPILQARPLLGAAAGVLYCDPIAGERARCLFESVVRRRLERFGARAGYALAVSEKELSVARGLEHLIRARPSVVLVASTTAPATPEDVVGRALKRIGAKIERFLAPVEPGSLLLLAYHGNTPIVSAPGCFRSVQPNIVDRLLPALLADHRVSSEEVAALGHGGLIN